MIDFIMIAILAIVVLFIYFLPSVVAHSNRHKNEGAIILLNLFLGWTLVGWVAALVWTQVKDKEEEANRLKRIEKREKELRERECPFCAEKILKKATICKHCGKDVTPLEE